MGYQYFLCLISFVGKERIDQISGDGTLAYGKQVDHKFSWGHYGKPTVYRLLELREDNIGLHATAGMRDNEVIET